MRRNPELTERRDRDFILACRAVISSSSKPLTTRQVATLASQSRAPEFYVSIEHASRVVRIMRRSGVFPRHGTRAQYAEISRRAERFESTLGISTRQAVGLVLARGDAPSFYLTPKSAMIVYRKMRLRARRSKD